MRELELDGRLYVVPDIVIGIHLVEGGICVTFESCGRFCRFYVSEWSNNYVERVYRQKSYSVPDWTTNLSQENGIVFATNSSVSSKMPVGYT